MNTATDYAAFLETKGPKVEASGFEPGPLHSSLYPFQRDIVTWAVRRGRAAIFADCGMGKTRMQVEWARQISEHTHGQVLFVAPIAVAEQTIDEAKQLGVHVERVQKPLVGEAFQITNYERLHLFADAVAGGLYEAIVLDESSILKSMDGKTRTLLIQRFSSIPYRLCCTATPAPNDVAELANHAEFLGAMSRVEMLATFFVHDSDDGTWRLKGHAESDMWRWMTQWAVFVRRPSDLGYADEGWALPPLNIADEVVTTGLVGQVELGGIGTTPKVRKMTLPFRVRRAAEIIIGDAWTNGSASEPNDGVQRTASTSRLPPGSDGPQSPTNTGAGGSVDMDSQRPSSNCSPLSRASAAPSAAAPQAPATTGAPGNSTSTTITGPALFAGSSATPAIADSDSSWTIRSGSSQLARTSSVEHWVVWCDLNAEEDALAELLGDQCVVINGKDSEESRTQKLAQWFSGERRVLISKAKVFGWGLNFQHCARVMFLGLGHSYELFYQAIRRCWRFGQSRPVDVRIVVSDVEGAIADNVKRKELEANRMAESIVAAARDGQQAAVRTERYDKYEPKIEAAENWALMLGDCVERIREVPDASVGFTVYSPPFASLYTYSSSQRDMGNCRSFEEFFEHYRFLIPELLRVTMPGRRLAVHCQQLSTTKATHGHIGWRDFRGELIRAHTAEGWIYDGEICIDKNPQAQAIRTKSKQLMFVQKERDSSWLRPAMADYILLFRHPGENTVPVKTDVTNEEWILFAHPIWYGIRESNVLRSYRDAREGEDEKHICPLQLETIERCIRLWSNRGEVVLSPFAGIGSEGYVARRFGRQFIGIELKESYWQQAVANLQQADAEGIAQPTEAAGLQELKDAQAAKHKAA